MIDQIQEELKLFNAQLVAVSKTKPVEQVLEIYQKGQRVFGENRVQECVMKYEAMPKDIQWHLIGHLQTNKVKYIAPFVSLIHSVDSPRLLTEINKQALANDRIIDCLLQFHIADEDTKYGLDVDEAAALISSEQFIEMKNIRIVGVMGMATFTENMEQVRSEFRQLKRIYEQLKEHHFESEDSFKEISMGMSGDYQIALEEGSTMVRIGSLIFGRR